jgi:monomeric isocitrate dehydrogenase
MIGEHNEWDIEVSFYVNQFHMDKKKARVEVINRWMCHGDFRPLAASIREGDEIDRAVLSALAQLIDKRWLKLVPKRRGRGRQKDPTKVARQFVAASMYHATGCGEDAKSDDKFEAIAETLHMSHQSVRNAVTAQRKAQKELDGFLRIIETMEEANQLLKEMADKPG